MRKIDRVGKLDFVLVLDQGNEIRLRSNQSMIKSHYNPNDSMKFLKACNMRLDDTLIQTNARERF